MFAQGDKPQIVGSSPYPTLKAAKSSHMPALFQYAEAEAVLRKVRESSWQLETNLDLVLQSRQPDAFTDETCVYCSYLPTDHVVFLYCNN